MQTGKVVLSAGDAVHSVVESMGFWSKGQVEVGGSGTEHSPKGSSVKIEHKIRVKTIHRSHRKDNGPSHKLEKISSRNAGWSGEDLC